VTQQSEGNNQYYKLKPNTKITCLFVTV